MLDKKRKEEAVTTACLRAYEAGDEDHAYWFAELLSELNLGNPVFAGSLRHYLRIGAVKELQKIAEAWGINVHIR